MTVTDDQYLDQLQRLLPQGGAWPREQDANLTKVLHGLSGELARGHNRALDLVEEADPRTTFELLDDWEDVAGLPDPCITAPQTLQARRDALVARVTSRGGQSIPYYTDLAAALGYEITIDEFNAFRVGSLAGDLLTNEGAGWEHTWRVNGPDETVQTFKVGQSGAGEALRNWGNEELECAVTDKKPAHTVLQFAYVETLYLDFTGDTLPAEVTFSRPSAGYYTNSDGTLTSFASGAPRIGDRGLLIEEARTNLLLRSQEIDQSPWLNQNSTETANSAEAPDGTTTADTLTATGGNAQVYQGLTYTAATYVVSCYFKKGGGNPSNWVQIQVGGINQEGFFDVENGIVGTTDAAESGMEALANGWYRCWIVVNSTAGYKNTLVGVAAGDNSFSTTSETCLMWGLQVELGAFPTSYIKTEGSTVTRAADVATIDGVDLLGWANAAEGTVVMELTHDYGNIAGEYPTVWNLQSGSGDFIRVLASNGNASAATQTNESSSLQMFGQSPIDWSDDQVRKIALAYKENDFAFAFDGEIKNTDTNALVPAVTTLNIGRGDGTNHMQGHARNLTVYPRRVENSELQELTS